MNDRRVLFGLVSALTIHTLMVLAATPVIILIEQIGIIPRGGIVIIVCLELLALTLTAAVLYVVWFVWLNNPFKQAHHEIERTQTRGEQ